jgi:hypothetical protein
LWVARTLREESRAPAEPTIEPTGAVIEATDSMIGTTGGEEAEIVVGNGATSGRARRWTQEIGALAAFTAVFFIYSMAR